MLPLHIGTDHPLGMVFLLLLAFGPFLLAGVVVFIIRRHDLAAEQQELDSQQQRGSAL